MSEKLERRIAELEDLLRQANARAGMFARQLARRWHKTTEEPAPIGETVLFGDPGYFNNSYDWEKPNVWLGAASANGDAWHFENDCGQGPCWYPLPDMPMDTWVKE